MSRTHVSLAFTYNFHSRKNRANMHPSPTLIHIDMREPGCAGALCKKGCATDLWQQLQLALLELRTVHLIPAPKAVDSPLGVISMHGSGKLKSGDLSHH